MGAWLSYMFTPSRKVAVVKNRRLLLQKQLGEGGYSFVYLAKDVSSGSLYALKRTLCQTEEVLAAAQEEINILRTLESRKHPNIISLVASDIVPSQIVLGAKDAFLLMPYYKYGTLQDILDGTRRREGVNCTKSVFSPLQALSYFYGICDGVLQLHSLNPPLIHLDLKPGNILNSSPQLDKAIPVLMDFGSVSPARRTVTDRQQALALQEKIDQLSTPLYRSPELFDIASDQILDERTDVWSLGCILYTIMYNKSPFESTTGNASVALAVLSGQLQFPPPQAGTAASPGTQEINQLIRDLLQQDPKQRPFLPEVLNRINSIRDALPSTGYVPLSHVSSV